MAVITNIRNRSGLLITVIGVAMALFVAGDLLNSGQSLFIQQDTDVAVIGNQKVSYEEFENRVRTQIGDQNVDANTREIVRNRVWNQLIQDKVYGKEYESLGIAVSPEELFDQIKNTKPNSVLYQYFTDPQTGQIFEQFRDPQTGGLNTQTVLAYANQLISQDQTANWLPIESAIKKDRIQSKYTNMIEKGIYFNSNEIKIAQKEKNTSLRVSYVAQFYRDIKDEEIEITDADLKKYYNEHKSELIYQQPEATRSIDYKIFEKKASKSDIADLFAGMTDVKTDFGNTENDTLFVVRNSDRQNPIQLFSAGELPMAYDSLAFQDSIGTIYGPVVEGETIIVTKKIGEKIAPDSVEARHILLPITEGDTATAKAKADSLKSVIKRRNNFAEMATEFSEDLGSAQKGGDLGWFTEGTMVKPFNDASFNGEVGDMPIVVSKFGVHLIEITNQTNDKKKVLMATVERNIAPSKATSDNVYNEASSFSIQNNSREKFVEATQGIGVQSANFLKESDKKVNDIENARELVRWIYANEKNAVSEPFEYDDKFVIAMITEVREAGTLPLENVEDQVRASVLRDKKAEKIMSNMKGDDLNAVASSVSAQVQSIPDLQFSSFSVPGIGPEQELIGKAFSLPIGKVSEPIKGNTGVFVIKVEQSSDKGVTGNEAALRAELNRNYKGRVGFSVLEALKEDANIKDNRAKFY